MSSPATKQLPSSGKTATPVLPAKQNIGRFRRVCRRLFRMTTSHLGLIAFLVAFSFAGAAIFHAIEGDNEKDEKADIQWLREEIINRVWNSSVAVKRNEQAFRLLLRHEMKKYEAQLYVAFGEGINTATEVEVWDFWGSLFYCATVYTTIGYGNIYPATDVGRVVTIIYSLIGIPLCLIVLADLGKLFTRAIKWVWSFFRRFYYTRRWSKAGAQKVTEEKAAAARAAERAAERLRQTTGVRQAPPPAQPEIPPYVVDDEFNLPVTVAIIITFIYILIGALIYRQWEDWSYLEAFYFVFISVSTIGFGDVLPDHPKYFLLSSLYVLIGLSLVAMVINVIMEAMTHHLDLAQREIGDIARTVGVAPEDELSEMTDLTSLNGSARRTPSATPLGVTPVVTPAPSVSTLNTTGSPITPSSARDIYGAPLTGHTDPAYTQDTRGRAPYRDRPGDYPQDNTDLRRREPYEYRGDDYRGGPSDYRGGPSDYRGGDPRGDPRIGDRSPDRRMADPRYADHRGDPRGDLRGDPRMGERGDPRFDPRSPTDPRPDPRFDQRSDSRGDPRQQQDPRSQRSYGSSQQPQGRNEFY